jgi:hypothetical protein
MWPHSELKRHRPVCFDPICHQNPRSERYSNPFSDSFSSRHLGELGQEEEGLGSCNMATGEPPGPLSEYL